jgi:ribosomal protein L40E
MEPNTPVSRPTVCPDCGAPFPVEATYCWLCGWKLGDPVGVRPKPPGPSKDNPYASPAPRNPADLKWTFSLSTLFLWTALVAVVMGVVRIAPGLGIALGIFSLPAALHTTAVAAYRKRRSRRALTVPEKILVFIESLALFILIAIAVVIAAIGALFVICMQSMNPSGRVPHGGDATVPILATVGGVILVLFIAYVLVQVLWRRTKD